MTTETLTVHLPVERTAVALTPTATGDDTKSITDGCGKLILFDNRHNGNAVTVTFSTRADPFGRTVEPGNPITIPAGSYYVCGPYPASLFGQGSSLNDLQYTIACTSSGTLAAPGEAAATQSTGGSIANGDYDYYITAVNGNDLETVASTKAEVTVAAGGGTASVIVLWEAVAGGCAYRVYGRTKGATGKLLHTVAASPVVYPAGTAMSWTDTGAIAESAIEPPAANAAIDSKSFFFSAAIEPTQATL